MTQAISAPIGARQISADVALLGAPHFRDRTAAGIARSFTDAGYDVSPTMVEALATRIARDGGMQGALSARADSFSLYTDVDRWLGELIAAESDADHPETALASLVQWLELSKPGDRAYDARLARAKRLSARIAGLVA